jgi:glutathione S-transferase
MKLYFSKGACSLAVRITIHELGLSPEYIAVDLKSKKTEDGSDYLKINPKGAVPALMTDNKNVLTENSAIQQYLADTHHATQLLPTVGDYARYQVLEWLGYINSDVHKSFGPLFNGNVPADMKESIFIPILKSKFNFLDKNLEEKKYLLGETFTVADAYLFVMITWLPNFKIDINDWKNVSRYFNDLKMRKSVQQALTEEGLQ